MATQSPRRQGLGENSAKPCVGERISKEERQNRAMATQYVPMPGTEPDGWYSMPMADAGERPLGAPVKVPREDVAFISDNTLVNLLDPKNLNSSQLQDIYQVREDDFETPQELEVWYMQDGKPQKEFLFIDPLHSNERPRLCVSLKAVEAMHRAIAVLTRKLDNVLVTLRRCRTDYYKELLLLRELVHKKMELKKNGTGETVDHSAFFFDANSYQDEVSLQLFQERIEQATADLRHTVQMKNVELRKVHTKINKMENGYDLLERAEQKDLAEDLNEAMAELEVTKAERDQKEQDVVDAEQRLQIATTKIGELQEEIDLARELVQKKEEKHNKNMDREYEEKAALERRLVEEGKAHAKEIASMKEHNNSLGQKLAAMKHSLGHKQFQSKRKAKGAHRESDAAVAVHEDAWQSLMLSSQEKTPTSRGLDDDSASVGSPFGTSPMLSRPVSQQTGRSFDDDDDDDMSATSQVSPMHSRSASPRASLRLSEWPSLNKLSAEQDSRIRSTLEERLEERRQTLLEERRKTMKLMRAPTMSDAMKRVPTLPNEIKADTQEVAEEQTEEEAKAEQEEIERAEQEATMLEIERLWEAVYDKKDVRTIQTKKSEKWMSSHELAERIMSDTQALAENGRQICLEVALSLTASMGTEELLELNSFLSSVLGTSDGARAGDLDEVGPQRQSRLIDHGRLDDRLGDSRAGSRFPSHNGSSDDSARNSRQASKDPRDFGSLPTTAQSRKSVSIARSGLDSGGRDALDSAGSTSAWDARLVTNEVHSGSYKSREARRGLTRDLSESAGRRTLDSAGSTGDWRGLDPRASFGVSTRRLSSAKDLPGLDELRSGRGREAARQFDGNSSSGDGSSSDAESTSTCEDTNRKRFDRLPLKRNIKRQNTLPAAMFQGGLLLAEERGSEGSQQSSKEKGGEDSRQRIGSRGTSHRRPRHENHKVVPRGNGSGPGRRGRRRDPPRRTRSIGPSWSMPMHSDTASHVSQEEWGFGLARLKMALEDLPIRHIQVATELMSAGWVLYNPVESPHMLERYQSEPEPEMEVGHTHSEPPSRSSTRMSLAGLGKSKTYDSEAESFRAKQTRSISHPVAGCTEDFKGLAIGGHSLGGGRHSIGLGIGDQPLSVLGQHSPGRILGQRLSTGPTKATARQSLQAKRALTLLHKSGHLETEDYSHMIDHENLSGQGMQMFSRQASKVTNSEADGRGSFTMHSRPASKLSANAEAEGRGSFISVESYTGMSPRDAAAEASPRHDGEGKSKAARQSTKQSSAHVVQFQLDPQVEVEGHQYRRPSLLNPKREKSLEHTRSIATQTSITVVSNTRFEVLADKDDKPWRNESSNHKEKELLRARIAQELIMLALELRKCAGLEDAEASGIIQSGVAKNRVLIQDDNQFGITSLGGGIKFPQGPTRKSASLISTRPKAHSPSAHKRMSFTGVMTIQQQAISQEKEAYRRRKPVLRSMLQGAPSPIQEDDDGCRPWSDTCLCGVGFIDDSLFCRKCGDRRRPNHILSSYGKCQCGVHLKADAVICPECGRGRRYSGGASMISLLGSDNLDSLDNVGESEMSVMSTEASVSSVGKGHSKILIDDAPWFYLKKLKVPGTSPGIKPGSQQSSRTDLKSDDFSDSDDDDYPGAVANMFAAPALSTISLGGGKGAGKTNILPGMDDNLSNFNQYFGNVLNRPQEDATLPPLDDSVMERSRKFLKEDKRKHGSGPPRTPGRPQTQGGAPRPSPRALVDPTPSASPEDPDNWFPNATSGGLSSLPLKALLHKK